MANAMDLLADTKMPDRIAALRRDRRGYPVPRFVKWFHGEPDFRVIDVEYLARAVHANLCWICGNELGRYMTFTIGPMCCVNRVSSEPPSHLACADYAARVCPFLAIPGAHRITSKHPHVPGPGIMLEHNPGCVALWITKTYSVRQTTLGQPGALFHLGDPWSVEWFAEGSPATHDEVVAAFRRGLPALLDLAAGDPDPQGAVRDLYALAREAAWWTPGHTLPPDILP